MATGLYQVFKSGLTDNDITNQDVVGAIRYDGNGVHKYVKFSGTTAVAIGDVVCYVASDTTDLTVDGANTAFAAGVAECVAASGAVSYGWVRIKGVMALSTAFAGSPAVGDQMTSSGATAPAVTKRTAANMQSVGNVVNVSGKLLACDFPQ